MSGHRWTWVAARSTGTSHIRAGKECDDYGACLELNTPPDGSLIAVAADGAGSACHSSMGSRITTRGFVEAATRYLRDGKSVEEISKDLAGEWLDQIRDRIGAVAVRFGALPRDFATTLVGGVIGSRSAAVVHVGDGACVYRTRGEPTWKVASWPAQGEYAATTYFVTDQPHPSINFSAISEPIDEFAVFSDGIERLALDFAAKIAFAPFFDRMFAPLKAATPGRDRSVSKALQNFLDSPSVCDRTDDDKTLILARRVAE